MSSDSGVVGVAVVGTVSGDVNVITGVGATGGIVTGATGVGAAGLAACPPRRDAN